MSRSIVVTGLGLQSPHGEDPQAVFAALCRGESAVHEVLAGELPRPAAAATVAFDAMRWFTKLQLAGVDRVSQLAVAAADLAMQDAGRPEGLDPARLGVFVGCGMGGGAAIEHAYRVGVAGGRVPPLTIPAFMPNAPAAHVAMRQRAQGPVLSYAVACASSAVAIGEAFRALRDGYLDTAVAGGAESMINDGTLCAWEMLGVLAKEHVEGAAASSRPFSSDRTGFVLGEGAAVLVLECEDTMRARGGAPIAELAGFGCASDAHNLTQPCADGQARAMDRALRDARLEPERIGYINAHATATPTGDNIEIDAIKRSFGAHASSLAISSTKSMHGHLVGAAGALECAITALALQRRRIPPTAFLREQDPACDLDCVPCKARDVPDLDHALSNSFAFGGTDAALILGRA